MDGRLRMRAWVRNRLAFYAEAVAVTREVGAFTRTSAVVARAVAEPVGDYPAPRAVLEVGAGTGALTRALIERLGPGDRLDLCEINPRFVRLLREEFAARPAPAVRIFGGDVEGLPDGTRYDVIVSSLPWLNLDPDKVRRILARYDAGLRPGGTISYIDYWANGVRALVSSRRARARLHQVLETLRAFQRRYAYRPPRGPVERAAGVRASADQAAVVTLRPAVPGLVTLAALTVGVLAIRRALLGDAVEAAWLILDAMLLDQMDGALARWLKARSRIGAELDSFSDFVAFGLAPAFLTLGAPSPVSTGPMPVVERALALVYVYGCVLRLARYNTQDAPAGAEVFRGWPSTLAGALVATVVLTAAAHGRRVEGLPKPSAYWR
jgi:phospholipid N-methyltransferase